MNYLRIVNGDLKGAVLRLNDSKLMRCNDGTIYLRDDTDIEVTPIKPLTYYLEYGYSTLRTIVIKPFV